MYIYIYIYRSERLSLRDMLSLGTWKMGLGCSGKILPPSPSPPPSSPARPFPVGPPAQPFPVGPPGRPPPAAGARIYPGSAPDLPRYFLEKLLLKVENCVISNETLHAGTLQVGTVENVFEMARTPSGGKFFRHDTI